MFGFNVILFFYELFIGIDMSKRLIYEERIRIVLIFGECSNRVIVVDFNVRYFTRLFIFYVIVSKLFVKFREIGLVLDLLKCFFLYIGDIFVF